MTAMTGFWCLIASRFKLGVLADFLSRPILMGLLNGVAITIMVSQLSKIFGFTFSERYLIERIAGGANYITQTHLPTLAMSLVAPAEGHRAQAIETLQKAPLNWHPLSSLKHQGGAPLQPPMITLCIGAGRKDKLRPGDILGALTGEAGIPGAQVGKIAIFDFQAFVAVDRSIAKQALQRLNSGKIKGRSLRVRIL